MVRARRETAMFRTGTRGQGVVTAVDVDSTKVINEVNVPVRFTVDISSPSVAGFTREFAMLLPTRTVPVVGDRIDVALDDHRPPRVALRTDWATNTRGGTTLVLHHGGENDGALQALQDLRERGVLSEDELAAEAHRLGQGGDTR